MDQTKRPQDEGPEERLPHDVVRRIIEATLGQSLPNRYVVTFGHVKGKVWKARFLAWSTVDVLKYVASTGPDGLGAVVKSVRGSWKGPARFDLANGEFVVVELAQAESHIVRRPS